MPSKTITDAADTTLATWDGARQAAVDSRTYSGGETLVVKGQLEGRELVVIKAKLNTSDENKRRDPDTGLILPGEFVSATCLLREPIIVDGETVNLVVFNDGGVGIRPTIATHINEHLSEEQVTAWQSYMTVDLNPAIYCRHGLRPSRYDYTDGQGNVTAATTWYLA